MAEGLCPVTGNVCPVLTKELLHPGRQVTTTYDSNGRHRTTVNNTEVANLARSIAEENPVSCTVFGAKDVCGAIYSRYADIWTSHTSDLSKLDLDGLHKGLSGVKNPEELKEFWDKNVPNEE